MQILSQSVPNIFNGVSQQPPALRSPTQGTEQVNADSSLIYGLSKRMPTRHIATVNNFTYTNAHVHLIESGSDRFIAIFDGSGILMYNADTGAAVTVNTPSGLNYVTVVNPRDNIKCLTVADYTFVLNRAVTVATTAYSASAALAGTVNSFSDLPALTGTYVIYKIVGTGADQFNSYYVGGDTSIGAWVETVFYPPAGTSNNGPDPTLQPWTLRRTGASTFEFQFIGWALRPCGDPDTNPNPSFVNRTIRDIFFYRDRLGFITSDTIVMSRAGAYFNMWPRTMTAVSDDDPIDATVAHPKIVSLNHAVPFNSNLLIFGDRVQFQMTGGDVLSPRTARIDAITEFESSPVARPVGIGPNVYFSQPGATSTLMREMYIRQDSLQNDASDITAHCPTYLPTGIFDLAASSLTDTLYALSADQQQNVYVYRSKWKEDEKIQSCWSRWEFGSVFDGSRILGIATSSSYLYLVVSRTTGTSIERMEIGDTSYRISDKDGTPWTIRLDKQTRTYLSGTYDATNDWTTWTLPYDLTTTIPVEVVVFGVGSDAGSGQWLQATTRPSVNTVRYPGNFSAQLCLAGTPYTMRYTMSPFYVRGEQGAPDVSGRLQLRKIDVMFRETGYLRVEVTPLGRSRIDRVFNPSYMGLLSTGFSNVETGKINAAVMSNAETVKIDLVNDTPYPSSVFAVEWTGMYSTRTKKT
jgi:hypothetical protein